MKPNPWIVAAVNAALIAGGLAAVELVSRRVSVENLPFADRRRTSLLHDDAGLSPDQIVYETGDDGVDESKPRYRVNHLGLRGPEVPPGKPAGESRVVILGGSHVFDIHDLDHRGGGGFPLRIEKLLDAEGYATRVLNAGIPGADTRDILARCVEDIPRLKPDVVVLNTIWNDLAWISDYGARQTESAALRRWPRFNPFLHEAGFWDEVLGWSSFYRRARDLYWQWREKAVTEEQRGAAPVGAAGFGDGLAQYERNLRGFVSLVRGMGAVPVLAVEEHLAADAADDERLRQINIRKLPGVRSHEELVSLYAGCSAAARRVSARSGAALIDISGEMSRRPELFHDHVHTTREGSAYIAARYAEKLKALGLAGARRRPGQGR